MDKAPVIIIGLGRTTNLWELGATVPPTKTISLVEIVDLVNDRPFPAGHVLFYPLNLRAAGWHISDCKAFNYSVFIIPGFCIFKYMNCFLRFHFEILLLGNCSELKVILAFLAGQIAFF